MSFTVPEPESAPNRSMGGGLHIPADSGLSKWVYGDTYTIKLTGDMTNGSLGIVHASVPPGGGPVPHTHAAEDEIFYLLSGKLEFLSGEKTFTAAAGDIVFIPRTLPHRFLNVGISAASMLFMYTPGGAENLMAEIGDEPQAGVAAPMWGPERLGPLAEILVKYGVAPVMPEA